MELNLPLLHEAVAAEVPERECLVWRDRRLSWLAFTERSRRVAAVLHAHGLGCRRERATLAGWEAGQDLVALYLHNGTEYLEAMLGAMKARAAPFNVNYRYTAEELAYLLGDAAAAAVVFHGTFAPTLATALAGSEPPRLLLQVDDGSGEPLLRGAIPYEDALAGVSPALPPALEASWSPDDLYVLYTGGTTGRPRGVLWRQADFLVAALGVRRRDGTDIETVAEVADAARRGGPRALPSPPFMHGAAQWNAMSAWLAGGTVVIQDRTDRWDAGDVLATAERERVTSLQIVGDAFARPLIDALRRRPYDLSALRHLTSGGAVLSASTKQDLLTLLPQVAVVDIVGSSESGRQGITTSTREAGARTGVFDRSAGACVVDADRRRILEPGDPEVGWLAQSGRVPLGYLGDPARTDATFPVIDGARCAVPGDRARLLADGSIELLGRESVTINTGGEKVFAEEVEHALKHHPAVYDALVVGRPSDRWGQEVVAVVRLRPGWAASPELEGDLRAECGRHLARYKLPKAFVYRGHIARSPSGKPDYRWARAQLDEPA
ncbi:MAG: acyl-CoA synthetase [Acidimicrobiales bacterium]|nr:acyl-CoA synthetase [Acidimicrobiales bacterium]